MARCWSDLAENIVSIIMTCLPDAVGSVSLEHCITTISWLLLLMSIVITMLVAAETVLCSVMSSVFGSLKTCTKYKTVGYRILSWQKIKNIWPPSCQHVSLGVKLSLQSITIFFVILPWNQTGNSIIAAKAIQNTSWVLLNVWFRMHWNRYWLQNIWKNRPSTMTHNMLLLDTRVAIEYRLSSNSVVKMHMTAYKSHLLHT